MVVEKSSAILGYPKEISKSLNADHHTVCKFDSNQDSNYISIRNALKTLVNTIRSTGMWTDERVIGIFNIELCILGSVLAQIMSKQP